jgi:sugar lactone lactonase YvrE
VTDEELYVSRALTDPGTFTSGAEGPACDAAGNLYAVNYARQGTIGRVTPAGEGSVFLELPNGSVGNGIRFDRAGNMFVADYTNHAILKVEMATRALAVFAHDPTLNQPNDIAIDRDDTIFASDPDWRNETGQVWRIGADGIFVRLEAGMGTTNGIEVDMTRRLLYVNETAQRRIWAYDLPLGGHPRDKRLLIEFPDFGLDGMRCDVAGNLYVTRWGKGTVAVVSPVGRIVREVRLQGHHCTNLAFGGLDGRTCYVTVADTGAIEMFRTEQPGQSWWLQREPVASLGSGHAR